MPEALPAQLVIIQSIRRGTPQQGVGRHRILVAVRAARPSVSQAQRPHVTALGVPQAPAPGRVYLSY